MKSQDIRQSFIDFFAERGHQIVPSAPLVPHGDPTLMFTNAGMVPFKDFFLGLEDPPARRAVSTQKCMRVSGKHNDLENVGPSPRHHTFFEMLGNFSFGDYFKAEAIEFGWDLVTKVWQLPIEHLYATVYEEDDEAADLWAKISTLPPERIVRCGAKDNFWAMGETGPCGPSSEIHVDLFPDRPKVPWDEGTESGRYLEIWNLVFMQFDRDESGAMQKLPNPSIDTGAGLERVTAVMQGVHSNYDTDLFQPILKAAAEMLSIAYGRDAQTDVSLRVIADHLRALGFLLADGVIPGPDGRGYVLRRLLRRAVRHGMRVGFEEPFLHRLVPILGGVMGHHYQELGGTEQATVATIREEEEKYLATRAIGAKRVQLVIDDARQAGRDQLTGEELFVLYDTHGLEIDTVREIAQEEQLSLDEEGFAQRLDERREGSRAATGKLQRRMASLRQALYSDGEPGETEFLGYRETRADGTVLRMANTDGEEAAATDALASGSKGVVVLDKTAFYAESGGQVGDQGDLNWPGGSAKVLDTQKDGSGTIFHFVEVVEGRLETGVPVEGWIDVPRRRSVERHHTATHLLHAALRDVLGEGVRQAGSLVAPDRLRFDFTHNRPVTEDEMRRIEDQINLWTRKSIPVGIALKEHNEAVAEGAMALFGEKYGDRVRTVRIPGFSYELCGGCHVENSGQIGLTLLTSERGVASGIRRIEALSGDPAYGLMRQRQDWLDHVGTALGVPIERASEEIVNLKSKAKELERELAKLRMQQVTGVAASSDDEFEISGIKVVAREVPLAPNNELRSMADALRDKLGSGVVILGARDGGKVTLIATVSKDLTKRLSAGNLVRQLAAHVDGRGGGRPDFAQAGGKAPNKLPELLAAVPAEVEQQLAGE